MRKRGFTLVELLVVIAIIGLLSTVAVVALSSSQVKARNQKRKADLVQISKALELYYENNGQYPSTSGNWYGHCSGFTSRPDTDPGSWIPGLTSGGYIASLPRDPRDGQANPSSAQGNCLTAGQNCYLYRSIDGTDYKLLSHCAPEGSMSSTDAFYDSVRPYWAWTIYTPGARLW